DVHEVLLRDLGDGLDPAPVDHDVEQGRRGVEIPFPEAVMDRLEMPHALAGLRVQAHQALGEEIVSGSRRPVVVVVRRLDGRIDIAELLVRAHLPPDARVPRVGPRVVQPGVAAVLARAGDGMECPELLAGTDVVTPYVPLIAVLLPGVLAGRPAQPADDDDVAHDKRRPAPPEAGGRTI